MEWLFFAALVIIAVVVVGWMLPAWKKYMALNDQAEREHRNKQRGSPRAEAKSPPPSAPMRTASLPRPAATFPDASVDLRGLETFRTKIKGTGYVVPDHRRLDVGGTTYALIREPENEHDGNAIAVHDGHQLVGYVSAARAGSMAPLLDQVGAPAYLVAGAGPGEAGIRLWMDLPKIDALRQFIKNHSQ